MEARTGGIQLLVRRSPGGLARWLAISLALLALTWGAFAIAAPRAVAATCATGTASFGFLGAEQCYQVGSGVGNLSVVAVGAPGGVGGQSGTAPSGLGADGAMVAGVLPVVPGETLFVEVGGEGGKGTWLPGIGGEGGAGGFNGGGAGGRAVEVGGGGGGGATDLRSISCEPGCPGSGESLESRLLVAAGGGGGGGAVGSNPGGAGGSADVSGVDGGDAAQEGPEALPGLGGAGGTAVAGGAAGADGTGCGFGPPGGAGQLGLGGPGGFQFSGGGGGGGGYFGGGGGGGGCGNPFASGGGGGGGSGFGPPGASFSRDVSGTPMVKIVPRYTLSVARSGTGSGEVAISPAGIDCGSTCSAEFDAGAVVTLRATAAAGSTFAGWSGAGCSGSGECKLTVGPVVTVTASFEAIRTPPPPVTVPPPPGKLFANRLAAVVGKAALLQARCRGAQGARCAGVVKLTVGRGHGHKKRTVGRGHNRRKLTVARGHGHRQLTIGKARYDFSAGTATVVVRVPLTSAGRKRLRRAGRRGLRVQLEGEHLKRRTVTLKSLSG